MEEDVATLADAVFLTDAGGVAQTFTDDSAETEFTLVHPLTGDVMGTAQYQQLYLMLHSLYLHVAAERDAAEALFMPTPVTEPEV